MWRRQEAAQDKCGNITELCSQLGKEYPLGYSGEDLDLGKGTFTCPPQSSDSATSWAKTPLWLGRSGSLFSFAINPDTFAVSVKPLSSHIVCVVSEGPNSIRNGVLQLGPQAALLFDGSCSNLCMVNTVIKGGTIICHGGCNVTFQSVQFQGCTLLVLAGSKVTVKECSFTEGKADKVALCCTGPCSTLKMHQCEVASGWDFAVLCKGAKASVDVQACTITGSVKGTVGIIDGAAGNLTNSYLYDCAKASSVKVQGKESHLTLRNCHVEGAIGNCVEVIQGASALLTGCSVYRALSGALAYGVNSQLELDECVVGEVQNSCVELVFGARAMLKDCTLYWVTMGPGVRAQGMGATVRMHNCTVQDTQGSSVDLDSFATAELRECTMEKSYNGSGVKVSGKYAHAEMHQCCVSNVEHSCVEVSYGAEGYVKGCLLQYSRAGAGVAVRGSAGTGMLVAPKALEATAEERGGLADTRVLLERSILENNAVEGAVPIDGGIVGKRRNRR